MQNRTISIANITKEIQRNDNIDVERIKQDVFSNHTSNLTTPTKGFHTNTH